MSSVFSESASARGCCCFYLPSWFLHVLSYCTVVNNSHSISQISLKVRFEFFYSQRLSPFSICATLVSIPMPSGKNKHKYQTSRAIYSVIYFLSFCLFEKHTNKCLALSFGLISLSLTWAWVCLLYFFLAPSLLQVHCLRVLRHCRLWLIFNRPFCICRTVKDIHQSQTCYLDR